MIKRYIIIPIVLLVLFSGLTAISAHGKTGIKEITKIMNYRASSYTNHSIIEIYGGSDFTAANGVVSGDGTADNPYIISGWNIDAKGGSYAIYISDANYVYFIVENCYLHNTSSDGGSGIYLTNVQNGMIYDNNITNNTYGIDIDSSTKLKIYDNQMINDGIYISGDEHIFTTQDISTNNTVNGKPVYYYVNQNAHDTSIPTNAGEVILGNVSHMNIENLNISNSTVGMEIGYSSYLSIANNSCNYNREDGLDLYDSSNNTLQNNICSNNSGNGLVLYSSNNNTLQNNICNNNEFFDGMFITYSNNNTILNNTCNNNDDVGIDLENTNKNLIVRNKLENNAGYGIYIYTGKDDEIYYNLFYFNHESTSTYKTSYIQAYDAGHDYWNTSTGYGNYWYDWANNNNSNDQNGDGIVDWPYLIAGSAGDEDYYPLKSTATPLPPSEPVSLKVTSGDTWVNLTWQSPVTDGTANISSYNIYRNGAHIATVPASQLWYKDTNVVNGQNYTYYVTAVNSAGESQKSNVVSATPGATVPELSTWSIIILAMLSLLVLRRKH